MPAEETKYAIHETVENLKKRFGFIFYPTKRAAIPFNAIDEDIDIEAIVDLLKAVIVGLALAILLFQPIQGNRHCRVIPYPIAQFGFENLAMISIDGDGFSINHFFSVRI